MPDEVQRLGLTNPYDPVQNIAGATFLIKERLNKYSGSGSFHDADMRQILLAIASYNAGMGAVKKYGGIPPYRETQNYVKKIEQIYRQLCQYDGGGAPGADST
jgi:soluble lytic murein transglycosylase-like protein